MLNLKNAQLHLAGLTALFACATGIYIFAIRPIQIASGELKTTVEENIRLQQQLSTMETEIENRRAEIDAKLQSLKVRYELTTPEGQPLMAVVSGLLNRREIELVNLREQHDPAKNQASVELQMEGHYSNLMYLLDDLRKLDRPVRIHTLHITPKDKYGTWCGSRLELKFSDPILLAGLETASK